MNFKAIAAAAALLASASSFAAIVKTNDASTPSNSELVLSIFDSAGKTYALDLGLSLATFASGTGNYSWTVGSDIFSGFLGNNAGGLQWAVTGGDSFGNTGTVGTQSFYSTLTAGSATTFAYKNNNITSALSATLNYQDNTNQATGTMLTVANGEAVANGGSTASFLTTGMNKLGNVGTANTTNGNAFGASSVQFVKLANSGATGTLNATKTVFAGTWAFDGTTLTYGSTTPAVPEPGTYAMLIAGLAAVGFVARRRAA